MSASSGSSCEDLKPMPKRRPVRVSGWALALLSFQTIGTLSRFLLHTY